MLLNCCKKMYKVTVEPAVFLYSISYTVQLSVQQDLVFSRLCVENYPRKMCELSWQTTIAEEVRWVQAEAVRYVMIMSIITSLVGTVAAQFYGAALDRYSQRTVMAAPFLGSVLLNMVCVVVASIPSLPLPWLYTGGFLNGICGGYALFKSSVSSYVVRTVEESARTSRLSVVEGMLLLGSAIGPLVLKQCLDSATGPAIPHKYLFLGNEVVIVLATLYVLLILPDHQAPERQSNKRNQTSLDPHTQEPTVSSCECMRGSLRAFSSAVKVAFKRRAGGRRIAIFCLLLADFFIAIVYAAEFDLLYLYMQNKLGFTLAQYSSYLALKNIVNGVSLLFILPALRSVIGLSDLILGVMGGLSRAFAFTLLALIRSNKLIFTVPFVDVFGQYLFVVLRSTIASLVNEDEQGRVLTLTSSLAQLSLLAGSIIFDNVYPVFLSNQQPGYTFFIAAASMAIAAIILGCVHCHLSRVASREELQPLL